MPCKDHFFKLHNSLILTPMIVRQAEQLLTSLRLIQRVLWMGLFFSHSLFASDAPFADIHLHFNWDQKEIISADEVVKKLRHNHVDLAVVSSVPSDYALELAKAGSGWIIPLFSPYITAQSKLTWFKDDNVLLLAREGIESGHYKGIGELHLWDGMNPKRDNKILLGLLELAQQYDVPFLIHTESSRADYFMVICRQHTKVRFLWAHAGGKLRPEQIKPLMDQCPNVWVEVSARDPWRYDSLTDEQNHLPDTWKDFIITYADRVMVGSDPVWNVTRTQRWDEADTGWDHLDDLIAYHRHWLNELPAAVEEKVRLTNAKRFFLKQ